MVTDRSVTSDTPLVTSPQEAAQRAGVGRSTIMRAIKSNQLRAFRSNRNQWRIDCDDLERWIADRLGHDRSVTIDTPEGDQMVSLVTPMDTPETLAKLAAAEAERDGLRERLDELKKAHAQTMAARDQGEEHLRTSLSEARENRDEWKARANELERRRSWWPWK